MAFVVDVQFEMAGWRKAWPRATVETRQLLQQAHKFLCASPVGEGVGARQRRATDKGPQRVGSPSSRLRQGYGGRVPRHSGVEALAKAAIAAPRHLRPHAGEGLGSLEVSVVFACDERLRALNAQFRGKDRPTNVLSFENPEAPLGGIALAFETVFREAKAQRKPFVNHSKHLILHGFLHLAGYDHQSARTARLMEGLEIAILSAMGIPNPYVLRSVRA